MKKRIVLPTLLVAGILASCNPPATSSENASSSATSDGGSSSSASSSDSSSSRPSLAEGEGILGPLGELRLSQGRHAMPSLGTGELAIIPVTFAPEDSLEFNFAEAELKALYDRHFSSNNPAIRPTAKDFYERSSFGNFDLDGEVLSEVVLPNTFNDYLQAVSTRGLASVLGEIATYAYDESFGEDRTPISDFDADGNGVVDAITLAYRFPIEYVESLASNEALLNAALQLFAPGLIDEGLLPAGAGSTYWMSGTISPSTGETFSYADAYLEIGYHLGLDNLSDTTGDLEGNYRLPLGATDLMDAGNYDHNPLSKYLLGWIEPTKVIASELPSGGSASYGLTANEDVLLLSPDATGLYDEYLLVDHYEPTGLNSFDASATGAYLTEGGIRVYKVDARLVRGYASFAPYVGEPDYDAKLTLSNGSEVGYVYDFAYTNDGINHHYASGLENNFPLVTVLDRFGHNRHVANSIAITSDSFFQVGDEFGSDTGIPGFYEDYRFNGNGLDGECLGLTFSIDGMDKTTATLTVRKAD